MKLLFKSIYFICLILLILFDPLLAQTDTVWDKGSDRTKLSNIFKILSQYSFPPERQIYLASRANMLSLKLKDTKSLCLSYKYIGNGYLANSDFENAAILYSKAIKSALECKDTSIASDCYYNLSLSYKFLGNYALALKNSKIAFDLDYKSGDSAAMAESYNSIGIIYQDMGDFKIALNYYHKSLEILEHRKDTTGIALRYNNIGIIFCYLSDYEKAREYLSKSIEIFENTGNLLEKCKPLMSMGDLYERIEKYDSSMLLFNKVFEISTQLGDKNITANILSRLADIFYIQGEYFKALNKYLETYELKMEIKDFDGVIISQINIAKVYLQLHNSKNALIHLNNAYQLQKSLKSKMLVPDIYLLYYKIYKQKNEIANALKYYELYTSAKDSIFSVSNNRNIYELQTVYETEKKEKENQILRQFNKIQVLELSTASTLRNFLLIIAVLIFILTLILFTRYRSKLKTNRILNEQNALLEEQKKKISMQKAEIEIKNLQITDSIEYAKLIQQSMLPNLQILTNIFPKSFLLFMPRDIVSGDFYWFHHSGNKLIVVVADCTGHGVPGAFMSMIGIEVLSEIFENYKITEPDLALNYLRERISKVLQQERNGNFDGMDMAICIIDEENHVIEYAGAKIPLLLVENNQLIEIKADKFTIGGQSSISTLFTKHILHYQPPVSVYMFSDGYHDQFGGPLNAKISSNLFKELLFVNSSKSMEEQKDYFLDFHNEWKGQNSQIDDILVLGIEID